MCVSIIPPSSLDYIYIYIICHALIFNFLCFSDHVFCFKVLNLEEPLLPRNRELVDFDFTIRLQFRIYHSEAVSFIHAFRFVIFNFSFLRFPRCKHVLAFKLKIFI